MAYPWIDDGAQSAAFQGTLSAVTRSLPLSLANYCTGDGVAEDAAGFQAALDDLPAEGGVLTSAPGMKYRISTALTINGKADVEINLNGSYIESRIASGTVITVTSCPRSRWASPRFRLMAGAPSAFMRFDGGTVPSSGSTHSWWSTVYEPVMWTHINIPANFDGIIVENDNYWIEIVRPQMRKLTGTLTGLFRRGVSFLTASNACKVLGGSINNAVSGAYFEEVNSCEVNGTAFEVCTAGVTLAGVDNPGSRIENLRLESTTYGIEITQTATAGFYPGIYIGQMSNAMAEANQRTEVYNPNNVQYTRHSSAKVELSSSYANFNAQLRAQASDGQLTNEPLLEFEQRPLSSPVCSLTVDPGLTAMVGAGTLTVDSTEARAPTPIFPTSGFLRIEGEVFSYTGTTPTTFTGVTRALGGSAALGHAVGMKVRAALNQTVAVDTTGALIFRASSATPPATADDRGILHHRAFVTKLISYDPTSTSCSVQQVVGDQAGGLTVVTAAFKASFRPGTTNVIDLGVTGTRWRNLFLSGTLDHSGAAVGFYGTAPIAKPTGVAITAGGVHAALVSLGLIAA
jgi:hypothetical protein